MIDVGGLRIAIHAAVEALKEVAAQLPEPEQPPPAQEAKNRLRVLAFERRTSKQALIEGWVTEQLAEGKR
jgi:hypothetical protein